MIVLERRDGDEPQRRGEVNLIFGLGLIGASICRHLLGGKEYSQVEFPFSWEQPAIQSQQLTDIEEHCVGSWYAGAEDADDPLRCRINVLWSAGKCGFNSNKDQTSLELNTFRQITELAQRLSQRVPGAIVAFHLVSSAGGLFEGSTGALEETTPAPLRPYGFLKLEQENLISTLNQGIIKRIYRPTSVYGHIRPNCRAGLIQTLLINGVRRRTSTIVGDLTTLRDYVFSEDIGRFAAGLMLAPGEKESECYLLSSRKASSICEVQRHVESAIGRKLYVNFVKNPTNSRDIPLGWRQTPEDWSPVDLRTGIRAVHDHWRAQGYAWQE